MENEIKNVGIYNIIKEGPNKLVEIYKQSNPEQKEKILKILGGLGGFAALLKFLKNL